MKHKALKAFTLAVGMTGLSVSAQALTNYANPGNYLNPASPVCHTAGACINDERPEKKDFNLMVYLAQKTSPAFVLSGYAAIGLLATAGMISTLRKNYKKSPKQTGKSSVAAKGPKF